MNANLIVNQNNFTGHVAGLTASPACQVRPVALASSLNPMNAKRRESIQKLHSTLEILVADLEQLQSEEQEAFDNMPDGLKNSDKGQRSEEICGQLQTAVESLQSAFSDIEDATQE